MALVFTPTKNVVTSEVTGSAVSGGGRMRVALQNLTNSQSMVRILIIIDRRIKRLFSVIFSRLSVALEGFTSLEK